MLYYSLMTIKEQWLIAYNQRLMMIIYQWKIIDDGQWSMTNGQLLVVDVKWCIINDWLQWNKDDQLT